MRVSELLNQLTRFPGHTHCHLPGELVVVRDHERIPLRDPFTLQQVLNFLRQFDGARPVELVGGLALDTGDGLQLLDTGQGLEARAIGERDLPGGWNQPGGDPEPGGRRSSDFPPLPSLGALADRAGVPRDRLADAIEAFTAVGRAIAEHPDFKAAGRRMIELLEADPVAHLGSGGGQIVLRLVSSLAETVDQLLEGDAEIPDQARVELAIVRAALERAHAAFGFDA